MAKAGLSGRAEVQALVQGVEAVLVLAQEEVEVVGMAAVWAQVWDAVVEGAEDLILVASEEMENKGQSVSMTSPWMKTHGRNWNPLCGRVEISKALALQIPGFQNPLAWKNREFQKLPDSLVHSRALQNTLLPLSRKRLMLLQIRESLGGF